MAKPKKQRKAATEQPAGFWDKPVLMDLVSDFLIVLGGASLAWAGVMAMQRLPIFPLRQLVVATPLEQVARAQIEQTARAALAGNFFTVNLDAVRGSFEQLPWVRKASVRRLWPDAIELSLEEHVAAARWQRPNGEAALVNTHGEVFPASLAGEQALPAFAGPEGSSANVLEHYLAFKQALAPLDRRPVAIALTARQAWEVKLDDGVVVELGRDQSGQPVTDRMARFAAYYPAARQKVGGVAVADMRYPNGFAVRPAHKS
ncbi:MAG TPA: cell division protein FtsQ/DivIB [Rhodocyclaceae bacterium]